jgi:hypothetical protein
MTVRKHDDSVKAGCGVDGTEGENYTKAYNVPDMQFAYPGQRSKESSKPGAYTDNDSGLTRTDNFEGPNSSYYGGSVSRQIWEDVEANQNPDGEFDTTGKISAGVNRSQK